MIILLSACCSLQLQMFSMLVSPLLSSFLDTFNLSKSSLGYNALCTIISFLILWSICLSSSLVHFKKGPEYLTRDTAQVFIPLIRFRLDSFVSSSVLVLLRYLFWIFPFISTCLMVSASKMPKYLLVSFSPSILILSWFVSSIPSVRSCLPLFITSMAHFSMLNSIPLSWLYILTACIRFSSSFSFFANSLMSSMYIRWLIFSWDLLSFYLAVHFLSMWFSGIAAIMNFNGDNASPWNIPLWIFDSAKRFPHAVSSTFQVFMVFLIKLMTSSDILYILRQFVIQLCGTIALWSIQAIARFFRLTPV